MYVEARGQHQILFLRICPSPFLRQGLYSRLTSSAGLPAREPQGSARLFHSTGKTGVYHLAWLFMRAEDQTQDVMLVQQTLNRLGYLPSPWLLFLIAH